MRHEREFVESSDGDVVEMIGKCRDLVDRYGRKATRGEIRKIIGKNRLVRGRIVVAPMANVDGLRVDVSLLSFKPVIGGEERLAVSVGEYPVASLIISRKGVLHFENWEMSESIDRVEIDEEHTDVGVLVTENPRPATAGEFSGYLGLVNAFSDNFAGRQASV